MRPSGEVAIFPLLLAIILLPAPPAAFADVLLLDATQQAPENSAAGLPRPNRGMSMTQVRQKFGEPQQEFPWVGEPPITRWVYGDFTVYFENEYVIDTVVHRNTQ